MRRLIGKITNRYKTDKFDYIMTKTFTTPIIQHIDDHNLGLTKFDTTRKQNTNPTRFLRVWVEYNRVLVIFVLTRLTRLINESYSC